jgi:hypothetical protein
MLNSLKISLVLLPLALLLVVGVYVYSLWVAERQRAADLPVDAADVMMRDLLSFNKKRGVFPRDLKEMEPAVWAKKEGRGYFQGGRAMTHRNYHYLYTHVAAQHFTLWAIPIGPRREDSPTWFLSVTPALVRRWKGGALPVEQVDRVNVNPSVRLLGTLGMTEQSKIELRSNRTAQTY